MNMAGFRGVATAAAAVVMLVLVLAGGETVEAVTCTATELSPCASAIASGAAPSAQCCSKLRVQKPCLCGYIRDPNLGRYVNSPNARKVLSSCGVPYPKC